jgi:hypothetical protein
MPNSRQILSLRDGLFYDLAHVLYISDIFTIRFAAATVAS